MFTPAENRAIKKALKILEGSFVREGLSVTGPDSIKAYCQLKIGAEEQEVFSVLFMDQKNVLIENRAMFYGTINSASVYPREILKVALQLNSAAIICYHNHPSSDTRPSEADKRITTQIQEALRYIDVALLDHLVVSSTETTSFAELGLL